MENLWGTRVTRLLVFYTEKERAGFALGAPDQETGGRLFPPGFRGGGCGGRAGGEDDGTPGAAPEPPSPPKLPGGAGAAGKFGTKERAWDGA